MSAAKEHQTLSPLQLLTDRISGEEVDGEKAKVAGYRATSRRNPLQSVACPRSLRAAVVADFLAARRHLAGGLVSVGDRHATAPRGD